jgi:hypothetical protein
VTKTIDPVGALAFDLRHAEALLRSLSPLLQPMIDVAVAAALQQHRDEQKQPDEREVLNLTEFCQRNHMGKS